jgi:hypothetical protein
LRPHDVAWQHKVEADAGNGKGKEHLRDAGNSL